MTQRIAAIAGATGMVGSALVEALLEDDLFARVVTVARRSIARTHEKLEQVTVDFAALDASKIPKLTDAFCALGTTIHKAGSQAAFRAVDHDAVMTFARAAKERGATRFYLVSALGADVRAMTFYNRVKGEAEADVRALGFATTVIVQPSLLLGDRTESRPAERAGIVISRMFAPLLKPFASRPIEGRTVALALRTIARDPPLGVRVYSSGALHALGEARG
jgi:uncharacterized protein YbjT (DUF2867 family)